MPTKQFYRWMWIIVFAYLLVVFGMSASIASAQGDACPDVGRTIYPTYDNRNVYNRPSFKNTNKREPVIKGEPYIVQGVDGKNEKASTPRCWIKIRIDDWLYSAQDTAWSYDQNPTPVPKISPTPRSPTISETNDKCYSHSKAYITGNMNIRQSASASSTKIASTIYGNIFIVSRSVKGDKYCWLKITKGWIAKTRRVSPIKPTPPPVVRDTRTTTTQNSCSGIPNIGGSGQAQIKRAFDYLCGTQSWFNYVSSKTSTINGNRGIPGGRAYVSRRHIDINELWYPNTMEMASVIVHEACHIHQWDAGRWNNLNPTAREVECINKQIEYVSQVAPGSSWLRKLRDFVNNPRVGYGR